MRNIHYLITALLKSQPKAEVQLLKLAQTLISVCPYDKMNAGLCNSLASNIRQICVRPDLDI